MSKLASSISDKRILKIIRRYLQSGVMLNGCCVATEEGTPQGGPISPLLANIMLNDLDKELTKRGHSFVRYADDCNIYVKSKRAGQRVYQSISKFIQERLKLKVNEEKECSRLPIEKEIPRILIHLCWQVKLRIAPRTKIRFKEKIRRLNKSQ